MRIIELRLQDYRVLRDITIRFSEPASAQDRNYTLTFLVGVNGSGKSTVLKALVDILRRLEQNLSIIPINFHLEYQLRTQDTSPRIAIDSDGEHPKQVTVDGTSAAFSPYYHLPHRVVIFTTGDEAEWEEQGKRTQAEESSQEEGTAALQVLALSPEQLAVQELPGRPVRPLEERGEEEETTESQQEERFLFIRTRQIPLLVLCGLLADIAINEKNTDRLLGGVLSEAKISAFRGFSLKFRMNQGTTDDEDREYVNLLQSVATQSLRLGTDYLLVFDLTEQDHTHARTILEKATSEASTVIESARGLRFFERLARLAQSSALKPAILREVNLFFERFPERDPQANEVKEYSPLLLFDWLSDGEQSFLGRMCLFSLLGDTEALILLDEPEVHFNDYWKRQIVFLIDKVLRGRLSHALITTHSSITLTDAPRNHIVILDRGDIYTSTTYRPGINTYAADPSDIIVSVFGSPQAAGAQSVSRVQEVFNMRDPGSKKEELKRLLDVVGPGYWRYRIRRELLLMGE